MTRQVCRNQKFLILGKTSSERSRWVGHPTMPMTGLPKAKGPKVSLLRMNKVSRLGGCKRNRGSPLMPVFTLVVSSCSKPHECGRQRCPSKQLINTDDTSPSSSRTRHTAKCGSRHHLGQLTEAPYTWNRQSKVYLHSHKEPRAQTQKLNAV